MYDANVLFINCLLIGWINLKLNLKFGQRYGFSFKLPNILGGNHDFYTDFARFCTFALLPNHDNYSSNQAENHLFSLPSQKLSLSLRPTKPATPCGRAGQDIDGTEATKPLVGPGLERTFSERYLLRSDLANPINS